MLVLKVSAGVVLVSPLPAYGDLVLVLLAFPAADAASKALLAGTGASRDPGSRRAVYGVPRPLERRSRSTCVGSGSRALGAGGRLAGEIRCRLVVGYRQLTHDQLGVDIDEFVQRTRTT